MRHVEGYVFVTDFGNVQHLFGERISCGEAGRIYENLF